MNDLLQAWQSVQNRRPYQKKSLKEWLEPWLSMSDKDLQATNQQFLKVMTTWVVRKYSQRRKGGVPTGYLSKFCLPENQEVRLFDTLVAMIVSILRKRGLKEVDQQPTQQFHLLNEAYDRVRQQRRK